MKDTQKITKSSNIPSSKRFSDIDAFRKSDEEGRVVCQKKESAGFLKLIAYRRSKTDTRVDAINGEELFYPELEAIRLRDAHILFPHHLVWTAAGDVVSDLSIWRGEIRPPELLEETLKLDDNVSVITNNNYSNFSHWHVEALPALLRLRSGEFGDTRLLFPDLREEYQRDTLHALGVNSMAIPQIARGLARISSLTYLSYSDHSRAYNITWPKDLQKISRRMTSIAERRAKSTKLKMFYLSRRDSGRRVCLNEEDLIAKLGEMGIESIVAGDLSYFDQVKSFMDTDLVVTLHGAGLNNIIYCRPGTVVIEAQPPGDGNSAFMRLAPINKLRYAVYQEDYPDGTQITPSDRKSKHADWKINVNGFAEFVRSCMGMV